MGGGPSGRLIPGSAQEKEWPLSAFPEKAHPYLLMKRRHELGIKDPVAKPKTVPDWDYFHLHASNKQREAAAKKLDAVILYHDLVGTGGRKGESMKSAADAYGILCRTLEKHVDKVKGLSRHDWYPALIPRWNACKPESECDPKAWDMFKSDWLRLEKPKFAQCYRRTSRAAEKNTWKLPSIDTLERRIKTKIPRPVRILAREGEEALRRSRPAQERDHSVFHAMEAVNSDGLKFDTFVKWPDGEILRPVLVGWQDIYSGKLLSWRLDKTENTDAVRLSYGDMVEEFGIPDKAYLDNGRAFASKWMTGGIPNRYRFKVKEEEPEGIMKQMGTEVHWVLPRHGQSKPIERYWLDLNEEVSRNPRCEGAYTGNKPTTKPENYASKAVPLADFLKVVEQAVIELNARPGRRSAVCRGRSLDEVFNLSYSINTIRKATAAQRRLWLLAAETITASKLDGSISLFGNRYHSEALSAYAGHKLVVRFDPQRLHEIVYPENLNGHYIGEAPCIHTVGFSDSRAAREHQRLEHQNAKATKKILANERKLSGLEVAEQDPGTPPSAPPESRLVKPVFNTSRQTRDAIPNSVDEYSEAAQKADAAVTDLWRQVKAGGDF